MMKNILIIASNALLIAGLMLTGCKDKESTAKCGNGVIESPEVCEGTDLNGKSCANLGMNFTGGALSCKSDCTFDTSQCTTEEPCGNGVLDSGEQCDGSNLNQKTCATLGQGFTGGLLACKGDCTFNTSGCTSGSLCGNGTLDQGEDCDGDKLNQKTCATLGQGFTGGVLACKGDCTFNTSGCTSGPCGNGALDQGEDCDGDLLGGKNCHDLDSATAGPLVCKSDCSFDTTLCFSEEWINTFVDAMADKVLIQCAMPFYAVVEPGLDTTSLKTVLRDLYVFEAGQGSWPADPSTLQACATALLASDCQHLQETFAGECAEVMHGTKQGGESCFQFFECQGVEARCEIADGETCGICVVPLAVGATCRVGQQEQDCQSELFCDADNLCAAKLAQNDPCDASVGGCQNGLYCDNISESCLPLPGLGQECFFGFSCADGFYCDGQNPAVCQTLVVGYVENDPCTPEFFASCGFVMLAGLVCEDQGGGAGLCKLAEVVAENEVCDDPNSFTVPAKRWCQNAFSTHYCAVPQGQTEGTCLKRAGVGESCVDAPCNRTTSLCVFENDQPTICEALPQDGDPCLNGENGLICQEGLLTALNCDDDAVGGPVCISTLEGAQICAGQ